LLPACDEGRQANSATSVGNLYVRGGILADLRYLLGESAIIESEYHQELDKQGTGKFSPVISLCKLEGFV